MNRVVHLNINNIHDVEKFYVEELGLFSFHLDIGIGNHFLRYKYNNNFYLMLSESDDIERIVSPKFTLEVNDVSSLYDKLKDVNFQHGEILNAKNGKGVFQYPLESNITLKDPSGNIFLISSCNW